MCGLCIGLHLKSVLVGKLFTISRNWPTIRGAVPLDQREPRSQSIRIQEGRERERELANAVRHLLYTPGTAPRLYVT